MSNSNSSNKVSVPEAKEAMNRFKQEVASELGVPLKEGYNGDLTSRQAGSIGGEMVKKMIMKQEEQRENHGRNRIRHKVLQVFMSKWRKRIANVRFAGKTRQTLSAFCLKISEHEK